MRLPFLVPGQKLRHALCSQPGLPVPNTHIQRAWHGGQFSLPALLGEPDLLSALSASVGILGVTGAVFTGKERGCSVCAVWAILFCGLARNALPKLAVSRVSFLCILSCPGKIVFQGTLCNREPCHGNNPGQIGTGTLAAIQHFIKPVLQKMHDIVHGEPFFVHVHLGIVQDLDQAQNLIAGISLSLCGRGLCLCGLVWLDGILAVCPLSCQKDVIRSAFSSPLKKG